MDWNLRYLPFLAIANPDAGIPSTIFFMAVAGGISPLFGRFWAFFKQ
ncbi:hypothetical protein [Nodularia chucula]